MLLRASFFLILALGAACGSKKGGTLMTDTPVLPFKAPDVEEISGVSDEPEPPPPEEPKAQTPPPAPTPVIATPAQPTTPPARAPAPPAKAPAPPANPPAKKP
jgi:hypothetical protein